MGIRKISPPLQILPTRVYVGHFLVLMLSMESPFQSSFLLWDREAGMKLLRCFFQQKNDVGPKMGFHSVSESSNDNGSDRCFPMVKYGSC